MAMENTTLPQEVTGLTVTSKEWSLGQSITVAMVILIMVSINIVGNSCTIVAFCSDAKLRTLSNYYIFNLAVTDLVIGFVSLPFYAVYTLMNYTWPFGRIFCKVFNILDYMVCAESSFTVLFISLDRLLMVKLGPGAYQRIVTKRRTALLIATTWLASFVLYGPTIAAFDVMRGYSIVPENDCFVEFFNHLTITAVTAVFDFFTPSVLIILFNALLYLDIRQRTRTSRQDDQMSLRKDLKAAKNLAILALVFLICWAPYVACALLETICSSSCVNVDLLNFFTWLLWLNSSINPLMYAASIPRFRRHFQRLLRCPQLTQRVEPSENTVNTVSPRAPN
ncbi:hypothetical protein CAPTEDRAFT_211129 [Capitella teleta]|uniref:G-protein coupled receptors family 1 profile domain-containing protein n=1 Tax=Capitella teleta TaxID=283909 RepID=R7TSP4_CAPTE|nr:hypothetical protein CAPTEDRAFT_211129 [Capitella teleta]|eukprot:ELT94506.1 hypothetical protein CAPTEDRAFT_211129 [Capitella teleta]